MRIAPARGGVDVDHRRLIRSTTSAKLTSAAAGGAAAARPGFDATPLAGAPAETADRAMPPATIAPTRNAMVAVRARVMTVKAAIHVNGIMADG
jgi:hypothetical protein